jgi:hypothetical protein
MYPQLHFSRHTLEVLHSQALASAVSIELRGMMARVGIPHEPKGPLKFPWSISRRAVPIRAGRRKRQRLSGTARAA